MNLRYGKPDRFTPQWDCATPFSWKLLRSRRSLQARIRVLPPILCRDDDEPDEL